MPTFESSASTLDVTIRDSWGSGFVADLALTTETALDGWTLEFEYAGEITNIWNARIVSRVGDRYVIENMDYNAAVSAGGTIDFGFQGAGTSTEITPISFNGAAFGGGTDDPQPDTPPTVSVGDAVAAEEDGSIGFEITLSEPSDVDVVVTYETVAGSATAGDDFEARTAQVTIPAGQTSVTVDIPVIDDATAENAETFELRLVSADGAEIADGSGLGQITDGDGSGDGGGDSGDSGPFVGGGQTYYVGQTSVVTNFNPTTDVLDLGSDSIHNQIPVDTADGLMFLHMFDSSKSLLLEGVHLADLHPENFAPIADAHLQQDLSAALAWEDGSGLVRDNTVYIRSHEQGLEEIVDFDPATDVVSFFYLSVRGDGELNFSVEETAEGVRFFSPITGQSITLRDVTFADLNSEHFEWRANQLEDNVAGRIGLADEIANFEYVSENVFSGKSVAMAGGVDRAPYHSQPEYTGTPIGGGTDDGGSGGGDSGGGDSGDGSTTTATLIAEDVSVLEGDSGTTSVEAVIRLSEAVAEPVEVTVYSHAGSASADDFSAVSDTLTFAAGETEQRLTLEVAGDAVEEADETFMVHWSAVIDGETKGAMSIVTILDDDAAAPDPDPDPGTGDYIDITHWGDFHGTSSHTGHDELHGGRTAITTEAMIAYNGLRDFLGLSSLAQETIGQWAFDNQMTNNSYPSGGDLYGVGLYYAMQGAKVGWIRDDAFDPQILADIQREARLGEPDVVMQMVEDYGHDGFAQYLTDNDLTDHFISTLQMEPHYGGWMHGRVHGGLTFPDGDGARSHDVNHLTVLSHDQTQPFMNDTFDYPQWAALDVPHQDVIDYFQSMVVLGDPLGDALPADGTPPEPDPVDPDPVDPAPDPDPDPVDPADDGSEALDAELVVVSDWGSGATVELRITNADSFNFTDGWEVEFAFDADTITGSWNGDWSASDDGDALTVSDVGWNGSIGAGQGVVVGFQLDQGGLDQALLNAEASFHFL